MTRRVVKTLSAVPLAIEQARAIIAKSKPLADFFEAYSARYRVVMSQKPMWSEWDYEKNLTVIGVLDVVRSKILDDPDALNLLALVSCMGHGRRSWNFPVGAPELPQHSLGLGELLRSSDLPQARWLAEFC